MRDVRVDVCGDLIEQLEHHGLGQKHGDARDEEERTRTELVAVVGEPLEQILMREVRLDVDHIHGRRSESLLEPRPLLE